jgi:ZIP family zinc transporter
MVTLVVIAILVFLATFIGGTLALQYRDKLHLILGFSAGAVLGVAFLDLLPEAVSLSGDIFSVPYIILGAILFYMVIDRVFLKHGHTHHDEGESVHNHEHENRGVLRASSLVVHSFIDGLAIGFAFEVSSAVGFVVAVAVLAHDFSDGINTVAVLLKSGSVKRARLWLLFDALAPVLGIIIGSQLLLSEKTLGYILAVFTGFFIYIALSDLVPESFHNHPKKWTTVMTILGVVFMALIIYFAKL